MRQVRPLEPLRDIERKPRRHKLDSLGFTGAVSSLSDRREESRPGTTEHDQLPKMLTKIGRSDWPAAWFDFAFDFSPISIRLLLA
jgi:hypothetical protein